MFRDIYELSDLRVAYFSASMQPGLDGVTRVLYNLIDELNRRGIQNVFFLPSRGMQRTLPVKS
jgi:hypothetical protein